MNEEPGKFPSANRGLRGPGKDLNDERMRELDKAVARIQEKMGDRPAEREPVSALAKQIDNLAKQRDGLCHLCAEILSTLTLPENKDHFDRVGPRFIEIVASWQKQFAKFSGDPRQPVPRPTIEELEKILNDSNRYEVTVAPDGSCMVVPKV